MANSVLGPRVLLRRLREVMAEPVTAQKRLDKIVPIRSTRMGPAIRHATHKLKMTDAKVKILVLLSDGRPQDHGYGRDRTEKEYAIHDTKQALNEAKREGITVRQVLTHEDISGGPRENPEERRGLAGCLPVIKIAGAAAEQGRPLEECAALAERMEANMATLAVALSGALLLEG